MPNLKDAMPGGGCELQKRAVGADVGCGVGCVYGWGEICMHVVGSIRGIEIDI